MTQQLPRRQLADAEAGLDALADLIEAFPLKFDHHDREALSRLRDTVDKLVNEP